MELFVSPGAFIVYAVIIFLVVFVLGAALVVKAFYKKVLQGQALINNKTGKRTEVSFTGALVLPIIHRAEVMDISLKTIEIDRRGAEGLICRDNIRADIKVTFFVRVNKTEEDVLKVAQSIGCVRASAQETIEELFNAKFSEALKTVGYGMDFVSLYDKRDEFKDAIIQVIGTDLNGYGLEDAAIDFLEQTPLDQLDQKNILDANGIRKITELTTAQHIRTNDFENTEKKAITKQDVEAKEAILALERQQEVAVAAQGREIATVRAREKAETEKVAAEEHQKAQLARIKAEEEIAVQNENRLRQVELAQKGRERAVKVETERVEKDRQLEAITRERETELMRIEKEKAIEKQKKEIADVIRGRVAVEKTVAEEEERIKEVRVVQEADRTRQAMVITAEAEAQENLVRVTKEAEAKERAAAHRAKERLVLADAELEAADREAKAMIRKAEGAQAEQAASGLAAAKVKEAAAIADEKAGMVKARVDREQMTAVANGKEEQGMADVRVRSADADVIEKTGRAEAVMIKEKGLAEAIMVQEKLGAEAKGLADKAESMKLLDGVGKEHEEFRIALEKEKAVELEGINAQRQIAEAQARLMGEAFKNTKIDIVGGEGQFFDQFVKAVSLGKGMDSFFEKSSQARQVFKEYLEGDRSLPADLKDAVTGPVLTADTLQKLTLSALLTKMMAGSDEKMRGKIAALMEQAKKLGVDKLTPGGK